MCSVILGSEYNTYEEALNKLHMKTIEDRRKELALKFAKKASKHPIHQTWFVQNPVESSSILKKPNYKPVCYRTSRFLNSAIPFLTNLLNEDK